MGGPGKLLVKMGKAAWYDVCEVTPPTNYFMANPQYFVIGVRLELHRLISSRTPIMQAPCCLPGYVSAAGHKFAYSPA